MAQEKWQALYQEPFIMIGTATCGRAVGALAVKQVLQEEIAQMGLDIPLFEVGCMGHCYAEPLVVVANPMMGLPPICYGYVTEGIARRLVRDYLGEGDPCLEYALAALTTNDILPTFQDFPRGLVEEKLVMSRCGLMDPENIEHTLALGGYEGLSIGLQLKPEEIISMVQDAGLRGRGGAGFPTGQKWEACGKAVSSEKYMICNADEGDPGAFMDRTLLESDPHAVIEGMTLAAYAIGAQEGYIYVRAEYPLAVQRIAFAITQARDYGLLGPDILGSGFSFDLHVFQGSGAFVCGEETALIASMAGEPGIPGVRPPYPVQKGLWGKPTVIDNVKTLANIPHIIKNGAPWFHSVGTEKSPGTAVFALAGKVINTGLVEVPMGTTLRQIIEDAGSGIAGGKRFKAVQIGGPSGACLPESMLDTPVDFDSLQQAGGMMGSGGLVVLDQDDCMVEMARYFLDFTQKESCGKCTFCRLGTKHMLKILEDMTKGLGCLEDIDKLETLAQNIQKGSLCNLGKSAPNPVLSTIRYFRHEYETHIVEKRCPSLMCKDLIDYYIVPEKCERSCDACVGSCPVEAIFSNEDRIKVIDHEKCVKCDSCLQACPPQYKAVIKRSPPGDTDSKGGASI